MVTSARLMTDRDFETCIDCVHWEDSQCTNGDIEMEGDIGYGSGCEYCQIKPTKTKKMRLNNSL